MRKTTFIHDLIKPTELQAQMLAGRRYYASPTGELLPSVTAILGESDIIDHTWLDEWKARVGEEEAKKVSTQAAYRGTMIHSMAENYVLNKEDYTGGHMPFNIMQFKTIQKELDEHVTCVRGIELALWSDKLKTAGRCDLVADWDGVPSIVDFKTSKRIKKVEDILGYFVQCSAYACMIQERHGLVVNQIVIVMSVDFEDKALVFKVHTRDYVDKLIRAFVTHRPF